MDYDKKSLEEHLKHHGKVEIKSKVSLENKDDLSTYYTPGVAAPCLEIAKDINKAYDYTRKWNAVAIISNWTAVLWLGDIGAQASLPVMEGKAILMKEFGWIDCVPIVLETKDPEQVISTIKQLAWTFGMIVLEDIKAPECFRIEEALREGVPIPVFHDDQHGTAIVVLAALINALTLVNKSIEKVKIVMAGAWAAGLAIARLLHDYGATNIIVTDTKWALISSRSDLNEYKKIASSYNKHNEQWLLHEVITWADVFIWVSAPNIIDRNDVKKMNDQPIIFALANPNSEITHEEAMAGWAFIYGSWRSDVPNQINNLLAFPGVVRWALDIRISNVTKEHEIAVAKALASYVTDLHKEQLLPDPLDKNVAKVVAQAMRLE